VYIRHFVKRKITCGVVSTLNMSLVNKRFNVWNMLFDLMWWKKMLLGTWETGCLMCKDTWSSVYPLVALRSNIFTSGPLICMQAVGFFKRLVPYSV